MQQPSTTKLKTNLLTVGVLEAVPLGITRNSAEKTEAKIREREEGPGLATWQVSVDHYLQAEPAHRGTRLFPSQQLHSATFLQCWTFSGHSTLKFYSFWHSHQGFKNNYNSKETSHTFLAQLIILHWVWLHSKAPVFPTGTSAPWHLETMVLFV